NATLQCSFCNNFQRLDGLEMQYSTHYNYYCLDCGSSIVTYLSGSGNLLESLKKPFFYQYDINYEIDLKQQHGIERTKKLQYVKKILIPLIFIEFIWEPDECNDDDDVDD